MAEGWSPRIPCRFFANGSCRLGRSCRFLHCSSRGQRLQFQSNVTRSNTGAFYSAGGQRTGQECRNDGPASTGPTRGRGCRGGINRSSNEENTRRGTPSDPLFADNPAVTCTNGTSVGQRNEYNRVFSGPTRGSMRISHNNGTRMGPSVSPRTFESACSLNDGAGPSTPAELAPTSQEISDYDTAAQTMLRASFKRRAAQFRNAAAAAAERASAQAIAVVEGCVEAEERRVARRDEYQPFGGPVGVARSDGNIAATTICRYYEAGTCLRVGCPDVHGTMCEICGRFSLHPTNPGQRDYHIESCRKWKKANDRRAEIQEGIALSRDKTCGVCFEVVVEKPPGQQRFGILPNCNHCFCLQCIRQWRQATPQFENTLIRTCPQCRIASDFVCPSPYWGDTEDAKNKIISDYKEALASKDCKYFKLGNGICPFGNKCFYRHAYPDGTKADVGPPQFGQRRNRDLNIMEPSSDTEEDEDDFLAYNEYASYEYDDNVDFVPSGSVLSAFTISFGDAAFGDEPEGW